MRKGIPCLVSVLAMIMLLSNGAAGYDFNEHSAEADSVRLVLNQDLSHDNIIALDVIANDVPSVHSAAFDIDFDSSVIEWAAGDVNDPDGYSKGDFIGSASYMLNLEEYANGTTNYDTLVVGVSGYPDPVSGSGNIVTINFRIIDTGQSSISFSASNLIQEDGSFTGTSWYGGTLDVDVLPPTSSYDDDPPVVTLYLPQNNTVFYKSDVQLSCSASDDIGLRNISLFTDAYGSWSLYRTADIDYTSWAESFYLEGVPEGTYRWNCLAQDSLSQSAWGESDSFFTVNLPSGDIEPPVRSNGQPSGNVDIGVVNISLETDEPATCKYSMAPGLSYGEIPYILTHTGSTTHWTEISFWVNMTYRYCIKCTDTLGNSNEDDFVITFSAGNVTPDNDPPVVLGFSPEEGLESGTEYSFIRVATEEFAECRISDQPGMAFGSMDVFDQTGSLNHTHTILGLSDGQSRTYYIKCQDYSGNQNTDTAIEMYVCYEADSDCSRDIIMPELVSYIDRWYMNSRDVSMRRMIQAVVLWKSGGG